MKNIKLGGVLPASVISLGCMRIADKSVSDVEKLIATALENGINHFDHADIYGRGKSEEVFGKALKNHPDWRKKMVIQTKCAIIPGKMYNFSRGHILNSLDGSLKRLGLDSVDALLLHRPDTLMEPEEIADAFNTLEKSGKVQFFGVSNCNAMQIRLIKSAVTQPIIANQLQLSAAFTGMIDNGFNVNMTSAASIVHDGGILEYCRLKNITVQAWSPFMHGAREVFIDSPLYENLNAKLNEIGSEYGLSPSAIAIAWILRHPANIQPIVGTANPTRLVDIATAASITLTREQWYEIYLSAGNKLP